MEPKDISGVEENEPDLEELEDEKSSGEGSDVDADFEKRKNKRMTEAEYAAIREQFELGLKRMVDLADEYGFTRQAIRKRFDKDQVKWGSRAHEIRKAVGTGLKAAVETTTEKYAENRLAWIEEARIAARRDAKQGIAFAKKAMKDAIDRSSSFAAADDDLKAVQRYNRIIESNYRLQFDILRAGDEVDEDDLPTLRIDDLTAERVVEFHRDQGITDVDELDEILNGYVDETGEPGA